MADKTTIQAEQVQTTEVAKGFYIFLGVMALTFTGIITYMLYLYLS